MAECGIGIGFRVNSGLSAHKCPLIVMIERLAHVINFECETIVLNQKSKQNKQKQTTCRDNMLYYRCVSPEKEVGNIVAAFIMLLGFFPSL